MKRELLVSEFLATPWAMEPTRLQAIAAIVASGMDVEARTVKRAQPQPGGGIAVLPLMGVITQRGDWMDALFGGGSASVEQFKADFRQAMADGSVGQILINIDSPGGAVYGVDELAEEIAAARGVKPVVAIANSLAASAAYWIGSSAGEFYVTPSGEAGSIGVWQAHFDYSAALAEAGIKPTLISAGKFKVEGSPYAALDPEAQDFMQSRVDDYYGAFTKAVARGRGVGVAQVRDGMGQGRVLGADATLAAGMVDGVATFDDVVRRMQRSAKQARTAAQAALELDVLNLG